MNILVLNGNPDWENTAFEAYLYNYQLKLHKLGHYVKTYHLREMKMAGYINPGGNSGQGKEIMPIDDIGYIFTSLEETDLLVFASTIKQGSPSVLTKIVRDRIGLKLQNALLARKANPTASPTTLQIPQMGMILQIEPDTTKQEILICRLTQERMAANLMTVSSLFITTASSHIEAVCATLKSADYQLNSENTYREFITGSLGKFNLL